MAASILRNLIQGLHFRQTTSVYLRRLLYESWKRSTVGKQCHTKYSLNMPKLRRSFFDWRRPAVGGSLYSAALFGWGESDEPEDKIIADLGPMGAIKFYVKYANGVRAKGDYEHADAHFHTALKLAHRFYFQDKSITEGEFKRAFISIYDSMGDLNIAMKNYEEGENLYKEAIKILLDIGIDSTNNAVTELSLKIACVYATIKKWEESKLIFETCIEQQEQKLKVMKKDDPTKKDTEALLGLALERYGKFLIDLKKIDEARKVLLRSEKICIQVLGKDHDQVKTIRTDIATTYILQKKYKEAEKILIGLLRFNAGDAAVKCNLGAISMRQNKFSEAKKRCEEALEIAKKSKNLLATKQAKFCIEKADSEMNPQTESIVGN